MTTRQFQVDRMTVGIFESNTALGRAAAEDFARIVNAAVQERVEAPVIFATGNSQLSFMRALRAAEGIPWQHIIVFHMDEYLGIPETHPSSFRRFIHENLTERFHPRAVYGIQGDAADPTAEIARYEALLRDYPPVLCVAGIGENGHLAFNDPPADFHTPKVMHIVTLDEVCRRQQVGEGHFASFEDVPKQALTLTVPALLNPPQVMILVPEARKADAVRAALEDPVSETCPASILRTQAHVRLYLDRDSAAKLTL